MNKKHQTFINEYLATGNKEQAYRKAYPNSNPGSVTNSVNRLLQREDVGGLIRRQEEHAFKKAEAALEKRMQAELLNLYETQLLLTQIVRGQHTTEKQVKENGEWKPIDVKPSHHAILRAINTYYQLTNPSRGAKATSTPPQVKKAPSGYPQGEEVVICLPPCGELERAPHPFGNIYPPNYPGPYYDPDDPNTKEKLQNLRLDRLTDCPDNNNTRPADCGKSQQNPPRHFECSEKSPEPMQVAKSEIDNQESSPPVLRRGGPQDRGGHPQHGQITSANNNNNSQQNPPRHFERREKSPEPMQVAQPETENKESSPPVLDRGSNTQQEPTTNKVPPSGGGGGGGARRFGPMVEKMLLRDKLRKEGWQTLEDAFNEVYDAYITNQHSGTYKMLKQFEKARDSRKLPPEERALIEKETGWTYHPQHSFMMKRTKP